MKKALINLKTETSHWIFLRGLARHSAHWGPFAEAFRNYFPLAEVELLDSAGNGTEVHRTSSLSIAEAVQDLRARSHFIKEGKSVYLFSISLGSMIATEWAKTSSKEVSGLVLINTSDRGTSWFYERLRPSNYRHILNILTHPTDSCLRENKIMAMTAGGFKDAELWAKKFAALPSTSVRNFARQLVAASNYRFPKEPPEAPVLLLASRHDQLVNSICTERIARMWKTQAHFHPNAGHDLPLWAPAWVCEKIENHFSAASLEKVAHAKDRE